MTFKDSDHKPYDMEEDHHSTQYNTIKKLIKENNAEEKTGAYAECFKRMPDEEVVKLAQAYDADALDYILTKYKGLIRTKARSYFLIGADKEDIIQEGMIGLYKAIRDFRDDKQSSFRAFAELCATRQIITAIKSATRQKHQPLNSYISLNKPVYDEESERTLIDVISGTSETNPEEIVIGKENYTAIEAIIGEILSAFELHVLRFYLEGKKYFEIAEALNRDVKSIDNAIQRIKAKVEKYISGGNIP